MKPATVAAAITLSLFTTLSSAAQFVFDTDPFAGSTALTDPGRQVVAQGALQISFSTATDVYVFHTDRFGINSLSLANDVATNLPATGANVVVLRTFDNDANDSTPFGAGNAATLIAQQLTESAPGFFVYFNSGLNLPRLVYSTDLSDETADLRVLAAMTNLVGQQGALAGFGAANFALIPEPAEWALFLVGLGLIGAAYRRARRQPR